MAETLQTFDTAQGRFELVKENSGRRVMHLVDEHLGSIPTSHDRVIEGLHDPNLEGLNEPIAAPKGIDRVRDKAERMAGRPPLNDEQKRQRDERIKQTFAEPTEDETKKLPAQSPEESEEGEQGQSVIFHEKSGPIKAKVLGPSPKYPGGVRPETGVEYVELITEKGTSYSCVRKDKVESIKDEAEAETNNHNSGEPKERPRNYKHQEGNERQKAPERKPENHGPSRQEDRGRPERRPNREKLSFEQEAVHPENILRLIEQSDKLSKRMLTAVAGELKVKPSPGLEKELEKEARAKVVENYLKDAPNGNGGISREKLRDGLLKKMDIDPEIHELDRQSMRGSKTSSNGESTGEKTAKLREISFQGETRDGEKFNLHRDTEGKWKLANGSKEGDWEKEVNEDIVREYLARTGLSDLEIDQVLDEAKRQSEKVDDGKDDKEPEKLKIEDEDHETEVIVGDIAVIKNPDGTFNKEGKIEGFAEKDGKKVILVRMPDGSLEEVSEEDYLKWHVESGEVEDEEEEAPIKGIRGRWQQLKNWLKGKSKDDQDGAVEAKIASINGGAPEDVSKLTVEERDRRHRCHRLAFFVGGVALASLAWWLNNKGVSPFDILPGGPEGVDRLPDGGGAGGAEVLADGAHEDVFNKVFGERTVESILPENLTQKPLSGLGGTEQIMDNNTGQVIVDHVTYGENGRYSLDTIRELKEHGYEVGSIEVEIFDRDGGKGPRGSIIHQVSVVT